MRIRNVSRLLASCGVVAICACSSGSDSATTSASFGDALNSAVDYMDSSLPDVSDGSVASHQLKKFFNFANRLILPQSVAASYSLNTIWSSAVSGEKVEIPGGSGSGCSEPTYLGSALPSTVNVGDYIGMSLDTSYERCSSGGGNYQPTIFGRFANATQILGYLNSFLPRDSAGVFTDGTGDQALFVDGSNIVVRYEVTSAADTTYYDKRVYVVGYADADSSGTINGGDTQTFSNLMWLRNSDSATNFMMLELGDHYADNGSNGEDGVLESFSITILNYNKSTGKMMFEYTSDAASAGTAASSQPTNPNLDIQRLLVESTGGAAHILSFSGASKTASTGYMTFAVYAPTGESSTTGTASVNYQSSSGADDITGTVCVTIASNSAANGACAGHTSAMDISAGVPAAVSTIRAYTGLLSAAAAKGISETGTDWTDSTVRGNWFAQGDTVSTAFDTVAEIQSDTDGTP